MKKLLLAIFTVLMTVPLARADDFKVKGICYHVLENDSLSCEVTSSEDSYSGNVVIPASVCHNKKKYNVTAIGHHAFFRCSELTSVIIPNSVTVIESRAFYGCSALTELNIPNSVTWFNDDAFAYCTSLSAFNGKFASEDRRCLINGDVLKTFAPAGLTTYKIPDNVTEIGENAFAGCSELVSVDIPESVTIISDYAFCECSALTELTIPSSVTRTGYQAFVDCHSLTAFNGKFASEDRRCLIEDGTLTAFAPAGLTKYKLPGNVTEIGSFAFYNSKDLTSVIIPDSVTIIEFMSFKGCSALTSLVIPASVSFISPCAFSGCTGLKEITSLAVIPPNISYDSFEDVPNEGTVLKVPAGSVEAYKTDECWGMFTDIRAIEADDDN